MPSDTSDTHGVLGKNFSITDREAAVLTSSNRTSVIRLYHSAYRSAFHVLE